MVQEKFDIDMQKQKMKGPRHRPYTFHQNSHKMDHRPKHKMYISLTFFLTMRQYTFFK